MPSLLVLECPWSTVREDPTIQSVSYFMDGVCRSRPNSKMLHSNFYDANSLRCSLNHIAQGQNASQLLYISAHGGNTQIITNHSCPNAQNINLANFFNISYEVEVRFSGVLLGCCFLGNGLHKEMDCNSDWIFGYTCATNWFKSTMIDCSIVREALTNAGLNQQQGPIINFFRRALSLFPGDLVITNNEDAQQVHLRDAFRLFVRVDNVFIDSTQNVRNACVARNAAGW